MKRWLYFCSVLGLFNLTQAQAQVPGQWRYQLLDASYLVDDCLACEHPTVPIPLRGSFDLRALSANPPRYILDNISFMTADPESGPDYSVSGSGEYVVNGQSQQLTLSVSINGLSRTLTNVEPVVRTFPLLQATVRQTLEDPIHYFVIHIVAAPFRELWFSVGDGFVSTTGAGNGQPGDLLTAEGAVVLPNSALVANLGFPANSGDLALDAIGTGPGGDILFSFNQTHVTEIAGTLQHGDIVSITGVRRFSNQSLLQHFGLANESFDYGLDALSLGSAGQVYFSISSNVFSPTLNRTLRRGDILSSAGQVFRSQEQLLSRFQPMNGIDVGVDALYVWPNGEVWFSPETGFFDEMLRQIGPGDILSDQGVVVVRNRELLSRFAPGAPETDRGMDALIVLSDLTALGARPRLNPPSINRGAGTIELRWTGSGGSYLLQSGPNPDGPFATIGGPRSTTSYQFNLTPGARQFFRVLEW